MAAKVGHIDFMFLAPHLTAGSATVSTKNNYIHWITTSDIYKQWPYFSVAMWFRVLFPGGIPQCIWIPLR